MTDQARDAGDDPHPDAAGERSTAVGGDADGDDGEDGEQECAHLEDVDDGAGCAEIWERTAEHRQEASGDDSGRARGAEDE